MAFYVTSHNYILLSFVDEKRRTASFAITLVFYALAAAAGGPISGRLLSFKHSFIMVCCAGVLFYKSEQHIIHLKRSVFFVHFCPFQEINKAFEVSRFI